MWSQERFLLDCDGTKKTLQVMAAAVRGEMGPDYRGYTDEGIRSVACRIVDHLPGHSERDEIDAIFYFVRDQIRYRQDPVGVERVQDPWVTLVERNGDCDDKCVLLATLLAALGHQSAFIVQHDGSGFHHVYCEAVTSTGEKINLDPTADGLGGVPLGHPGWQSHQFVQEWTYKIWAE